jgi:TolB-like protein/DNA-binding winged helix-turn-helix (wHTH) protein/Flp pilus assembly protein TadD
LRPFHPADGEIEPVSVRVSNETLRFGAFALDPGRASLSGPSGDLPLRPKAYDVLLYLIDHRGRVVSKDELMGAVWPNVFVTENSLVQCVSDIRAALGEEGPSMLKTVARRGYMFAAPVTVTGIATAEAPAPAAAAAVAAAPARRPARELLFAGLMVLVLGGLGGTWWWWSAEGEPQSLASTGRLSIAVLPLATLDSGGDEYLADGLTEDIIGALARFPDLAVLAPRTVAAYKGRAPSREEIARDLKVRYFAEGSVRRQSGGQLRLSMRLADAQSGTLVWSDQYDTDANQLIVVRDDIVRNVTGSLAVRMTNSEQARLMARPPASLEAYDLVLRGRYLLSRLTRTATSNARIAFERAVELDPNYAPAYVGLGRADLVAVHLGWTPDPAGTLRRAEARARKAVAIDEFNPAALALLGRIHARLGEYDRAVETLRHALKLNPSDPETYAGLGDALLWSGEVDEARQMLEIATRLDPRLPSQELFHLGAAYFLLAQYDRAAQVFERAVAREDGNPFMHAMLAAIYAKSGRREAAMREVAEVRRQNPLFDLDTFGTLFRNPAHREKIVAALQQAGM